MPDNKRPSPILDMKADPVTANDQPRQLPPPSQPSKATPPKRRGGVINYLFSGLIGGLIVAGCGYAVLTGWVPGLSLADPEMLREMRMLQTRTGEIDRAVRGQQRSSSNAAPGSQDNSDMTALRARMDGLVQGTRLIEASIQSLNEKFQSVQRQPSQPAVDPALAAQQAELSRQLATATARLARAEQEIAALNKAQGERIVDARSAALTLALTNLKRAVSDGRSFANELSAVETLSSVKLPVVQLATFKDAGVPTMADLQREFEPASRSAIEKHYRGANTGLMGEFMSRAKAAIQVRPADNSGITIEAITGRTDALLKAGKLPEAIAEVATLEPADAEVMRPWLVRAQSRMTAEETLRKTDQELLAALTRPPARR